MKGFGKLILGLTAGLGSSAIIAYCIYFDRKRRSDPNYKKNVRERRARERKKNETNLENILPDLKDQQAVERFFLQEVQLGEGFIQRAEFDSAAQHLYNALAVCNEPARLIQIFQSTLPAAVYAMIILKMKEINTRSTPDVGSPGAVHVRKLAVTIPNPQPNILVTDDVE